MSKVKPEDQTVEESPLSLAEEVLAESSEESSEEVDFHDVEVLIATGRPPGESFVRFHPTFRPNVLMFKMKSSRNPWYLVKRSAARYVEGCKLYVLYPWVTMLGTTGIWPVSKGDDTWSRSAHHIAAAGVKEWVRILSHGESGRFVKRVPRSSDQPEPKWPDITEAKWIELAFGDDRIVSGPDHPLVLDLLK